MHITPEEDGALTARHYTAPDIYESERARIMARTWQFAGHSAPLRKAGDYFVFEAAGENCFCVRGEDGEIRAFYNVCRHRAHELLRGAGNVRRITCPYHSWTYELDGRFRSAPNIRAVENFCRDRAHLREIRAEVFHGFVFVNMDDNAAPMDDWFPRVREEIADFVPDLESLAPMRWVEIPENCNWKVSVENYSECYHCALNHPAFSSGVIKPETYNIRPQGFCFAAHDRMPPARKNVLSAKFGIASACGRIQFVVFISDVFVSGISRRRAEHLSLASARRKTSRRLARLVYARRRRIRNDKRAGDTRP